MFAVAVAARNTKSVAAPTKAHDLNHERAQAFDGEVWQFFWNEMT
jgi:hypothetical protein